MYDVTQAKLPKSGGELAITDEMRKLLDVTKQCLARAVSAQQEAARYADHFRFRAQGLKERAARLRFPELQACLLRIAASHERLARLAEGVSASRDADDASDDRELPADTAPRTQNAAGYREEPLNRQVDEDPIATARRHVAEGAERVARQERLVARLSSDHKHAALAAEAREVLATMKHTLSLARQHLAVELKK